MTTIEARSADDPAGGMGMQAEAGPGRRVKLETTVLLLGILLVLLVVTMTVGVAPPG
ncbi:MAG: hypothetical protein P4L30_02435 [Candidatus Limnocylindrales bacterium]|nr:hypothetical protein [Candidatus Limnocylindrales bacterium]